MRPIKPPRLVLRKARPGQKATWIIADRGREISTSAGESDRATAEIRFAEYLQKNRQPTFGSGDPDQVLIGDCLTLYGEHRGALTTGKRARARLGAEIDRLSDFFGDKFVAHVSERTCGAYVNWRCEQTDKRAKRNGRQIKVSTAKRELVTLSAALNWCNRNQHNGKPILNRPVFVHMPAVAERRERWLSRSEVARLLFGALGWNANGERNRFRINRHAARFILIAFYTGTRHDAILRLQWMPNTVGGWCDLDAGILYRRPQDAIETNKKRTPCPIPSRLMPHLRRWKGLTARYVIEHVPGHNIKSQLRRAWTSARELAGFGPDITPHVLKHSCATVLLRAGKSTRQVAAVLGTSEQVIEKTYGHHAMDEKAATFNDVWSRPRKINNKRG